MDSALMDAMTGSTAALLDSSGSSVAPAGVALRKLSCGIVILNASAEILLCHVTGQNHWDLPKGGAQPGEAPLAAALRETLEETGLVLDSATLLDLGRLPYRARKDLHLYATLLPRIDTGTLVCDSHYTHPFSRQRLPEMDGYGWFDFARVPELCTRKLAAVLCERLSLPQLLLQLQGAESADAAGQHSLPAALAA
jgi:8-oxo-dGTP pyrophosphatase MutT (NUDIX family)